MSYSREPKDDVDFDVEKDVHSVTERSPDDFQHSNRFLRKLLSWGVEARGKHEHRAFIQSIFARFTIYTTRHFPRPSGAKNKHELQRYLLYLAVCKLQHPLVSLDS